jgi:heme-degrading monooxygenase HmoA
VRDDAEVTQFAETPTPPYTAVIFSSVRSDDDEGYDEADALLEELVQEQPGFLGFESAHAAIGITVSYWESPQAARAWKIIADHRLAQQLGRERWYRSYRVRVATVEREYGYDG